jgi:hypothetical protein
MNEALIAWFDRQEYEKLRAIVSDKHNFNETYDEWVAIENKLIKRYETMGVNVRKVKIKSDDIKKWCQLHGYDIDYEARKKFVYKKLQRR